MAVRKGQSTFQDDYGSGSPVDIVDFSAFWVRYETELHDGIWQPKPLKYLLAKRIEHLLH